MKSFFSMTTQKVSLSSSSSSDSALFDSSAAAAYTYSFASSYVSEAVIAAGIEAGSTVMDSDKADRFAFGRKPRPTTNDSALMARELSGLTT